MSVPAITRAAYYITFKLGDDLFAVDVAKVREVLDLTPITRVPTAPSYMRGVVNVRGSAIPVVDLRLKFGLPPRYQINGPFDVIFFRNVMIYFDRPTQEQVVGRQCQLLRAQGFFFISHTESLGGLAVPLSAISNAVYRKQP